MREGVFFECNTLPGSVLGKACRGSTGLTMLENIGCYSDPANIAFCTVVSIDGESTHLKNFLSSTDVVTSAFDERDFLLLIKSVIASKTELDASEAGKLGRRAANRGGDEENLQLQAPFVTT